MNEETQKVIEETARTTAYMVAQSLKAENSGFAPEIKEQIKTIAKNQELHELKDDERFERLENLLLEQNKTSAAQNEAMKPVIKAFEDNKITGIVHEKDVNKWKMKAKTFTVFATAIAIIWVFLKWLFTLLTFKI